MDLRQIGLHPDFWHPLARASEIKPGKTLAVSFAGEPIVLMRTEDGALHALEDRCAHRQVPLHEGVVCGQQIKCGYHGWTYDMQGQCVDVPYLPQDKQKIVNGVRSYPCREAYGFAFVFTGDPAAAERVRIPELPNWSDPRYRTRVLDRRIRCHYSFMHENLMDMNHQFLHRSLMGGISTILLGTERGDGWIETRYTFKRTGGKRPMGEKWMIGEEVENVDDKDTMTIRTDYPYQHLTFRRKGRKEVALDLWLAYVPVDREQKFNRTLGLMMIRRPKVPFVLDLFWPVIGRFTDGIFAQDKRIVELEQQAYDAQGADWNREVFPAIRSLREVLAQSGRAIQPSSSPASGMQR